ncbi:MAG: DinB family protein [Frankiales bacterium]|nr:DinB family protein [Frankiales bacterium]
MDEPSRTAITLTGPEREQLEAFLHDNRLEIVHLLDGLTQEQARRRLVPSLTTLLGLVKHAAERVWFDVALAGWTRAQVGLPEEIDDSFVLTDDDSIASVTAAYGRRGPTPTGPPPRRTGWTTWRCTTGADR